MTYPEGMENGRVKIPFGEAVSNIQIDMVKVFVPVKKAMLKCFRDEGGAPEIFIDVARPRPEYTRMKGLQVHIGIRGDFKLEDVFESNVKQNRIDIYMPADQLLNFIVAINECRQKIRALTVKEAI